MKNIDEKATEKTRPKTGASSLTESLVVGGPIVSVGKIQRKLGIIKQFYGSTKEEKDRKSVSSIKDLFIPKIYIINGSFYSTPTILSIHF